MNCKVCGALLTGTEVACPNCGSAVENTGVGSSPMVPEQPQVVSPQPQMNPVEPQVTPVEPQMEQPQVVQPQVVPEQPQVVQPQAVPEQPQMAPMDPSLNPNPVQSVEPTPIPNPTQNVGQAPDANGEVKPGMSKRTIILLVLMVLSIIGAILYYTVFNGGEEGSSSGGNGGPAAATTDTPEDTGTITHGGYTLALPEGYTSEENSELGLLIYNDTMAYTFNVDYSHTYAEYLASLQTQYPDQAATMEMTVGERKYIIVNSNKDGEFVYFYVTASSDTSTIVGEAAGATFAQLTLDNFTDLNTMLTNAQQDSEPIEPGADGDAGKNGLIPFTYNADKFKFANKEG